jgi:hypothetical protein
MVHQIWFVRGRYGTHWEKYQYERRRGEATDPTGAASSETAERAGDAQTGQRDHERRECEHEPPLVRSAEKASDKGSFVMIGTIAGTVR